MKKIIILGVISVLLTSCGVKNMENNNQNSGDNKVKQEEIKQEETNKDSDSTTVNDEKVDLTPEEEKMIEDLLDF